MKKNPTKKQISEYETREKVCKNCGKVFYKCWTKWTLSEFCSLSCSRAYSSNLKRDEINKKVSKTLCDRNFLHPSRVKIKYEECPKKCPICGTNIEFSKRKNKTCSIECGLKLISIKNTGNSNIGGQRDKGGRSKSGYYKGHFCGSTYELVYTIYNLDHNIPFERNTKGFPYEYKGKIHNYYPDYITPDGYVEIKGYWTELVDVKVNALSEPIKVLYEKDLQYAFDYVSKTYLNGRKTHLEELYDSKEDCYKYNYKCATCGKMFVTNNKRKEDAKKFCSVSCYRVSRRKR
jgi:hypothetical protein